MKTMLETARFCALCAAFSLATCANATDAVMTNVSDATVYWGNAANWTDGNGSALGVAPTNAGAAWAISFAEYPLDTTRALQTITTGGKSSAYVVSPAIDSIVGDERRIIRLSDVPVRGETLSARTFDITDPTGFFGYWTVGNVKATYRVNAAAGSTAEMKNFVLGYRPTLDVPIAGATVKIGELSGPGALFKTGDGDLVLGSTSGADARIFLSGGSLTLYGQSGGLLDELLDGAALHLDASVDSTLKTTVGADGFTSVTNWADVRGNGLSAKMVLNYTRSSTAFITTAEPPYVSPAKSSTGLALVDFGAHANIPAEVQTGARTNCVLELSRAFTNVREAFYVVQNPFGNGGICTVLGARSSYHFLAEGGGLFATYASPNVVYGHITRNGVRCKCNDSISGVTDLYTVSVGTIGDTAVDLIGSREFYISVSGGSRVGELLLYTNVLTSAERQHINRHLRAKWILGTADDDAESVVASAASVSVGVPAGKTASIGNLVVNSAGSFIKTGGGTLELGSLLPSNAVVVVEGGAVAFGGTSANGEPQAADGPYIWLDAEKDATLTVTNNASDPTDFVTAWKDCREGVSVTATTPAVAPGTPTVRENVAAVGGKRVLSFTNQVAWMALPTWNDGNNHAYAGFMVLRPHTTGGERPPFGSSTMEMYRDGQRVLSSTYISTLASSAYWTINGRPVDPFTNEPEFGQTTQFLVLAFASEKPLGVNGLCKDRTGQITGCGAMDVGEFILYHRPISAAERRETEAYLMRKWLGKEHPTAVSPVPASLKFASGVDNVFDFSDDFTVSETSGGTGSYVKRSSGRVTLPLEQMTNETMSVSVQGGTFAVDGDLFSDALFRFDASDSDSFTTTIDGNGGTRVLSWADTRGNGLVANSDLSYTFCETNPTLMSVTMPDGVSRPTVDFGRVASWVHSTDGSAAGLVFNQGFGNVREAHTVFADANGARTQFFFCDTGKTWNYYRDLTGSGVIGALEPTYKMAAVVTNGYIAVDGVRCTSRDVYPTGFHLISFQPTDNTPISSIAMQGSTRAGGCRVCEQVGFSKAHSPAARKYIEDTLMHKWLGTDAAVWPYSFTTLEVLSGCTLVLPAGMTLSAAELRGAGKVICGTLADVATVSVGDTPDSATLTVQGDLALADSATLSFGVTDLANHDRIEVSGAFDFTGTATVSIDASDWEKWVIGEYPLVTAAGGIGGFSGEHVSLNVGSDCKYSVRLVVKGNTLYLSVAARGLVISIR